MPDLNSGSVPQPGGYPPGPAYGPRCMVPDLDGLTGVQASALLQQYHLVVGSVDTAPSTVPLDGKVVAQDPAVDSLVAWGSVVDYTLGEAAVVPDIVGLVASAADAAIVAAGLTVGTVTTSSGTVDEVLSQSPAAGTKVAWASAVGYVKGV